MNILKEKREISVIIPTYNRSELLEYTLKSLALQGLSKERFEVIVADDGSTDDTHGLTMKYEGLMNLKYVFQEDKGYRPASARNLAITVAEGDLCLFIDSGIILDRDCLEEHILFHREEGPEAAAIGYVYGFEGDEETLNRLKTLIDPDDPSGSIARISGYPVYCDIRELHYQTHKDPLHKMPAPWYYFWGGHVSVSRLNLWKVGLFDEAYDGRWGVEDNDLGFRLAGSGIRLCVLRPARSIHYPHDSQRPEKERQGRENCAYFYKKFPTPETALFLSHFGGKDFPDINMISLTMSGVI